MTEYTVCMACGQVFDKAELRQPKNTRLAPKCRPCVAKRRKAQGR